MLRKFAAKNHVNVEAALYSFSNFTSISSRDAKMKQAPAVDPKISVARLFGSMLELGTQGIAKCFFLRMGGALC